MNKIYADGAFCRELNICGIGVYMGNGLEDWHEFSTYEKTPSSLEAELRSIEVAILRTIKYGIVNAIIFNDCQEAVDRINEKRLSDYPNFDFSKYEEKFISLEVQKVHRDFNIAHAYSKEGLRAGREHLSVQK